MQEVIGLVKAGRLELDSQAGRCVGYRQVLEYLQAVWGFPPNEGADGSVGGEPYSLKVSTGISGKLSASPTFHQIVSFVRRCPERI